MDNATIAC